MKYLIASGKDLGDIENQRGTSAWPDHKKYTALEIARYSGFDEGVSLLERFMANPLRTRHEVRLGLGMVDMVAAEHFALVIFLCDGLLQLKPSTMDFTPERRFFVIAQRLPMELQMILCHRAAGSMKQNVIVKHSESAFKALACVYS